MSSDLPYRAEYAKTSRASCRGCKGNIEKGTLRLAVLVQSAMFDGKMTMWYHCMCFFGKQRPKTVGDIEHFQDLKIEDQDKIRKKIADSASSSEPATNGKGKEKKATKRPATTKSNLKLDFKIEYSPSSRATCRACHEKIIKGEIRASKKDYESDEAKRFGGMDQWHHLECFIKVRSELKYYQCGDLLPGFSSLKKEDQANVKNLLPEIKPSVQPATDNVDGEVPPKKMKIDKEIAEKDKEFRHQNKKMFKMKKILTDLELKKSCLSELLEYNNQEIPGGVDAHLDRLQDVMTFGALLPCEKCQGQYFFTSKGYKCTGSISEWVACENINLKPARKPFKLPREFVEKYPEQFGKYKCKVTDRIIQFYDSSASKVEPQPSSSFDDEPKVKLDRKLPFKGMDIYIYGLPKKEIAEVKLEVQKLGGTVASSLHKDIAAVISTEEAIEAGNAKMKEIEDLRIQVVPKDIIEKCKNMDDAIDKIAEFSISSWGSDVRKRVEKTRETKSASMKSKSGKSRFLKSGQESKIKVKVQSGTAVDPDSGLVDTAHVYRSKEKEAYSVTLGLTDVQKGLNSYYKLQLLESNSGKTYWVFRGWGRIGTTIGGTKVESFKSFDKAKKDFKILYEDKTGNKWENHNNFEKVPGKMYPMKVDYGDSEANEIQLQALDATESKLKKPVQDLITMLFDIDLMKKTMIEYEIDLDEMPLGKISKSQMFQAYSVLTELQQFIEDCDGDIKPDQRALLIEATNRFYTLVPHDFGLDNPPLLQDIEQIKNKIEMLDSLLEMEFAYEIMQTNQEGGEHSLDSHYAKLNAEIDVIEREAKEFDIIQQYVKNTHAKTHSNYELEIIELFKVSRKEEEKRFKPFKKLPNRKLLWHGSRLTNFAGIISQGLRIAPPEAPTTGYMFGKGIYFADMVSKSANYCMTSPTNNTGLLMLCEVALGKMYERTSAEYVEKLPKGHHSCKGIGGTHPDPKASVVLEDGLEVPVGKATKADIDHTDLLYNEYIVYDIAQVKVKYLVKMNFKYKY